MEVARSHCCSFYDSEYFTPCLLISFLFRFFLFFSLSHRLDFRQKTPKFPPRAVERISHESLCLSAGCRLMTLTVKKHWHFAVCLFAALVKLDCLEAHSLARLLSPLTLTTSYSSSSSSSSPSLSPPPSSFSSLEFLLLSLFSTEAELYVTDNKHSLRSS